MIARAKQTKAAAASPATGICSIPNCTRPAKLRGVCLSCYQIATKLVQRGNTSWEELERLGVVRPPHAGPNGYRSPLYVALESARASAKSTSSTKAKAKTKAKTKEKVKS